MAAQINLIEALVQNNMGFGLLDLVRWMGANKRKKIKSLLVQLGVYSNYPYINGETK